jgi:hypothetical protein
VSRKWMMVLFVIGVVGCGAPSPPNPSDPVAGKETLTKALDAWKRGETHEAYKQSAPSVTVVDKQWKDGYKLLSYEIDDSVPDGFDVQFKAKLEVKDPSGKQSKSKAVYNVSTSPAFVIVRAME